VVVHPDFLAMIFLRFDGCRRLREWVMRCLFIIDFAMQRSLGGLLLRFAKRWPLDTQSTSVSALLHVGTLY